MSNNRPFTMIAAIIFTLMALVHAYRLVTHFTVVFGSYEIPQWASWLGLLIPAILAWGLWKEASR